MENIAPSHSGIRSGVLWQRGAQQEEDALAEPGRPDTSPMAADYEKQTPLWRLAQLPPELQDQVIGHLPVADVLVWQQLNKDFHHRIGIAALRERALCRSLGSAVPWTAFTKENYDELLQSWLNGFSGKQRVVSRRSAGFDSAFLFCAISRTLRNSQHLTLRTTDRFAWPGWVVTEFRFSGDGRYITVVMMPRASQEESTRHLILERHGQEWRQGSAFVGEQGAACTCFTADASCVAVAETGSADILIWNRQPQAGAVWENRQRLEYENAHHSCVSMRFSPEACWLIVTNRDRRLCVWHTDDWQLCGTFYGRDSMVRSNSDFCSPDEKWLLFFSGGGSKLALFNRNNENRLTGPAPVELGAGHIVSQAVFHPSAERLELFLVLGDHSMVLVEPREGVWRVRDCLRHPCGIGNVSFSPDCKHMVTCCCASSGFVLWRETRQQWTPLHILGRTAFLGEVLYRESNQTFVRWDPCGQWIMAGTGFHPRDDGAVEIWLKDSDDIWTCHREPFTTWAASRLLAVAADGQHLAVAKGDNGLSFMERTGATLIEKVRIYRPNSWNLILSMDPFGCFLAAADFYGEKLDILRVEEADLRSSP
ncbi:MAG: WD40 repeat domain-containing protein [Kistimonas sp.]|nr:WD40 repeat domain-containing protein [Kistimonas sp.]